MSPLQLWTRGILELPNSGHPLGTEQFEDVASDEICSFGIDWNDFCEGADVEQVEVPDTACPCGDYASTIAALSSCFDVTSPSEDYGISTYRHQGLLN
eukprot:Em0021g654a